MDLLVCLSCLIFIPQSKNPAVCFKQSGKSLPGPEQHCAYLGNSKVILGVLCEVVSTHLRCPWMWPFFSLLHFPSFCTDHFKSFLLFSASDVTFHSIGRAAIRALCSRYQTSAPALPFFLLLRGKCRPSFI